ncbi:MAG: autotransporter outer membrane beta-barrel domain-containing protein, partial [Gammaproteobacteria bacterium]
YVMSKHNISLAAALLPAFFLAGQPSFATDDDIELIDRVCNRDDFAGCLNGVSSSVTNGAGLRMSGAALDDVARERAGKTVGSNPQAGRPAGDTGLNAGDATAGSVFGMWGSYSYNDFDSDFVFQGNSLAYDADAHNVLAGFDRLFQNRYLLGVAFGYQWLDTSTRFNGGGQESDGFTVAPYAAVLLSDIFSLDVSGGYSALEYDQDRISPADGTGIEASFDSDRWFVATNLNAFLPVDRFIFGAKIGYLYTEEDQDRYLESGSTASANAGLLRTVASRNIDLEQLVVGGEIAYDAGNQFEPFFIAEYRNDLSRDNGNGAGGLPGNFTAVQAGDDDEVQLTFGLRYYTTWGVTSSFEYQRVEGRSDFDSDLFMFTLRAAL